MKSRHTHEGRHRGRMARRVAAVVALLLGTALLATPASAAVAYSSANVVERAVTVESGLGHTGHTSGAVSGHTTRTVGHPTVGQHQYTSAARHPAKKKKKGFFARLGKALLIILIIVILFIILVIWLIVHFVRKAFRRRS
ncbi:hypothetical protein [Streptomyces orinoci]|uniref:Uncharacterized protein n=1 Tax=Streptomyces orinoci TaxID=67339 RepID=A0ABV3JVN6_STRON|nr:hypothetical protein [Streptomyces orinoci]